jgi:hypothetical protein
VVVFATELAPGKVVPDVCLCLIEEATAREGRRAEMVLVLDHWKNYLALPHRLRSRKTGARRQQSDHGREAWLGQLR